jgi:hypothetical protein
MRSEFLPSYWLVAFIPKGGGLIVVCFRLMSWLNIRHSSDWANLVFGFPSRIQNRLGTGPEKCFCVFKHRPGFLRWKMEERRGGGRTRAARADYQLIYFKNAQPHIVAQGPADIQRLLTHGSPFHHSVFTTCQRTREKSSHTVSTGPATASDRLFLSTLCCAYLHQKRGHAMTTSCSHSRINSQPLRMCGVSCRKNKKNRKWFQK